MIKTIAPLFTGSFTRHQDTFQLAGDWSSKAGFISVDDLIHGDGISHALDLFGNLYPEAPRRAVASQWARAWALALLPVTVVSNLVLDLELPVAVEDLAVRFDTDGRPVAFIIENDGQRVDAVDPFKRFELLVQGHLVPLFLAVAKDANVSSRVLFAQAGLLFSWLVQVAREHPLSLRTHVGCQVDVILAARNWPDGRPNPFWEPIVTINEDGEACRRKRICCLSNELSRDAGLCALCPANGRKRNMTCLVETI